MLEFKTRRIEIEDSPVFICGMCPGRQRKNDQNREVFHGNRTGDLVEQVIKGKKNIFLTNVFNYRIDGKITKDIIRIGVLELRNELLKQKPYKVIALGNFAYEHVLELIKDTGLHLNIVKLQHPSYILRFNKPKDLYIKQFLEELE